MCRHLNGDGYDIDLVIGDHCEGIRKPAISTEDSSRCPSTLLGARSHRGQLQAGEAVDGRDVRHARPAFLGVCTDDSGTNFSLGHCPSPFFTGIAPLPTIRCDSTLRSFEVAELFLLFGAESLVDFGPHASVPDDQPCQQPCFCISQSFDLLLIDVFTADCKQFLLCNSKLCCQRLETTLLPYHDLLNSFNSSGCQIEVLSQRRVELKE